MKLSMLKDFAALPQPSSNDLARFHWRTICTLRALEGIALLNRRIPDWPTRIALANLDLGSGDYCVIGQLAKQALGAYLGPVFRAPSETRDYETGLHALYDLAVEDETTGDLDAYDYAMAHGFSIGHALYDNTDFDDLRPVGFDYDEHWAILTEVWIDLLRLMRDEREG